MQQVENKLNEVVKKAPFQLPDNIKEGLVKALPWITLVGGILSAIGAVMLIQALWFVNAMFGGLAVVAGVAATSGLFFMSWVAVGLVAVEAIMFFVAFGPLKVRKKTGWNILFWVSLIYVASTIASFLGDMNFASLIFGLVGDAIGLYLLFQVRSYYDGTAVAAKKPEAPKTPEAAK